MTIGEFQNILKSKTVSDIDIVQRYVAFGQPFMFENEKSYFDLKKIISKHFNVGYEKVIMVGSAKLGFSISPNKLWKPFGDESDIDMVVIDDLLFNRFWKDLYKFETELLDRTIEDEKRYRKFLKYFFKGWIRPDLFPFSFSGKNQWEDFFKSISYKEFGERKITGAIFKEMFFFENYHENNIKNLRLGV
jgi:hypothetical protein